MLNEEILTFSIDCALMKKYLIMCDWSCDPQMIIDWWHFTHPSGEMTQPSNLVPSGRNCDFCLLQCVCYLEQVKIISVQCKKYKVLEHLCKNEIYLDYIELIAKYSLLIPFWIFSAEMCVLSVIWPLLSPCNVINPVLLTYFIVDTLL